MTKEIGIGFIGTGFSRKVQIPAFQKCDGAKVVSIASGSLANAESAAKEFGIEHFTDDWRETVSHPDVDLVCIITPPNRHHEMFFYAYEQGKNILAEKPMAMNLAEAEEMAAAVRTYDNLAIIDHELRFQPGRLKAYSMIREGAIGKIRHLKYNFRAPHRGDPSMPWTWWSDIEAGGGALGAINSHAVDSFQWFAAAPISEVYCQLQTHIKHRPHNGDIREVTTDDEANMLLRFADGDLTENATGVICVSMVEQPEYINRIEIFGTKGAIRIEHRGDLYFAKNGESEWSEVETRLAENVEAAQDTGFARGFMELAPKLIEALQKGEKTIEHAATFEDGLNVQRVLDAARISNATGTKVVI